MFDTSLRDSQSTAVAPMAPERFDFDAYEDYVRALNRRVAAFAAADAGVLVYRRFRVAEVYGYECGDRALSLALQLGALNESMRYAADIPNFLEPWYGIGIGASAFGAEYIWKEGQAPATSHPFEGLADAAAYSPVEIENTAIGREQLAYVEYFLDRTGGRLPMSLSDVQSPLNIISEILPTTSLFLDMLDDPALYGELAMRVSGLMRAFLQKQRELIGPALALPGHGFASSTELRGLGASDDTSIMISNELFDALETPALMRMCEPFGGTSYHSCGNWASKIPSVLRIGNLVSADGAFTSQTDPAPNAPAVFSEAFAHSGKILNARAVGDADTVADTVKMLWRPGMKLIVCTYCATPEEQQTAYDRIHDICR